MRSSIDGVRVYEWPGTGACADLVSSAGSGQVSVFVEHQEDSRGFLFDIVQADGTVVAESDEKMNGIPLTQRMEFRRKILGLLLDLGVDRRIIGQYDEVKELVFSFQVDQSWSVVPFFVPDEAWDDRLGEFDRYVSTDRIFSPLTDDPFLVRVHNLVVQDREEEGVFASWGKGRTSTGAADTRADDQISTQEKILPERDRGGWLSKNVTFGRFVVPPQDEVELFRTLGERLPLLWPYDRLCEWIQSR